MTDGYEEVRLGEIPRQVYDEICSWLKHYAVGLLGLNSDRDDDVPKFIGSATLVTAAQAHYILTAAHVWNELCKFDRVGLAMSEYESRFSLERKSLAPTVLRGPTPGQWGPDLAFLRIPPSIVGTISAHKAFCNLSKQKEADPALDHNLGVWAFVGAPAVDSHLEPPTIALQCGVFFSGVDAIYDLDGYDYFDVGIDLESAPQFRKSFGGVSGGGLWHLILTRTSGGSGLSFARSFEGVAFYQSPEKEGRRFIRCHGRKSIFNAGLAALGVA